MHDNAASISRLAASDPGCHALPRAMHPRANALRVRRILPGEPLGDVQRLRREVYFHEQGQQRDKSKRIADGLDGYGMVIVVESGAQAVGTLRLHDFAAPAVQVEYGNLFQIDEFARAWPLQQVAVGTRFAVQSEQRVKGVVDQLIEETYRYAQDHAIRFGLVACEPSLHGLFEYYGFREYLPPAILPGGVDLLRMVLVVEDAPHLRQCDSPLQHLVRNPAAGQVSRAWLARTFKLSEA
ncbi:MAG TPA: GNAT family N-acyltransferase [Pseudoxanthomonas sp.]